VGKYYQAIRRNSPEAIPIRRPVYTAAQTQELHAAAAVIPDAQSLVPRPLVPEMPGALARVAAVQSLSERVAPQAAVDRAMRLFVTGCRTGDGATTVSAALAIDLSQRLSLRTLIIDANLRGPTLHRVFEGPARRGVAMVLKGALQIQPTPWPRLDMASCCFDGDDKEREEAMDQLGALLASYPAAIVDLGVVRLDARTLPLSRATDPILLVARYGATERAELSNTAAALRGANRAAAGVILNGAVSSTAKPLRRLIRG